MERLELKKAAQFVASYLQRSPLATTVGGFLFVLDDGHAMFVHLDKKNTLMLIDFGIHDRDKWAHVEQEEAKEFVQ